MSLVPVVASEDDIFRGLSAEVRNVGRPPLSVDNLFRVSVSVHVVAVVVVVVHAAAVASAVRVGRLPAVGRRLGSRLRRSPAAPVVNVVVGVVAVRMSVRDSEAEASCFCRKFAHLRILLDVHDVAEIGSEIEEESLL